MDRDHARTRIAGSVPAWLGGALLAAMVLVAYWPATRAGFIWDDDFNVTGNALLQSGAGLWRVWSEPGATTQYYPLVYTTFWLEHAAWGLEPFGYHLDNLLLHAGVAIALWRVLVAIGIPGAWLAAAIFALHPVQVETVAWVTERKNLLSMLFYLASAGFTLDWLDERRALSGDASVERQRASNWRYAAALLLFAAALLSKVTAVVLPPALLVALWWRRGRLGRLEWLGVAPMLACAIPVGLLTRALELELGQALRFEWDPGPLGRVLQASRAAIHYVEKLVWPRELMFVYPRWQPDVGDPTQYLYPALWLGVLAALFGWRARIGRGPLAATLFFLGTLAPTLGLFEVYYFRFSFVADHWVYAAAIGPIALFAAGLERAAPTRFRVVAAAALLFVLGSLTWQYSHAFRDSQTLWRDSLSKNPDAWLAHFNLGRELQREGRVDEAMEHYGRAAELAPEHADAWTNMGLLWMQRGDAERAIDAYQRALRLDPTSSKAHWNLGIALDRSGRFDAALPHLERALVPQPGQIDEHARLTRARARLGDLLARHGRNAEAVVHYRRSLEMRPDQPEVRRALDRALRSETGE